MKKNIQQTIYFCTGFILFILVFDNIIMFGISKSDKDQMGKINKVCNHSTVPEIAIFGSSVSDVGVSSEILQNKTGKTVYNYSLNGTPFYNYKGIIDELCIPKPP